MRSADSKKQQHKTAHKCAWCLNTIGQIFTSQMYPTWPNVLDIKVRGGANLTSWNRCSRKLPHSLGKPKHAEKVNREWYGSGLCRQGLYFLGHGSGSCSKPPLLEAVVWEESTKSLSPWFPRKDLANSQAHQEGKTVSQSLSTIVCMSTLSSGHELWWLTN